MPYFTKSQAREAAHRGGFRTEGRVGPPRQLNEEVLAKRSREATATDSFDVFLSHSHQDAELVLGAAKLLEERSLKVYVDWVVDRDRSNTATTPAHARMVRARMRQCRSLLYLCTDNSMGSKWTPWELGYFDAFRGTVAILPLLDTGNAAFSGAEYLGLYPAVKPEGEVQWRLRKRMGSTHSARPRLLVEGSGTPAQGLQEWYATSAR